MFKKLHLHRKSLLIFLFLCLTLLSGISIGYLTNHVFSENAKFESYTEKLFKQEVSGSALTLHYTLAYPQKQGISNIPDTLGRQTSDRKEEISYCQSCEDTLKSFAYSKLSQENQLTLDTLLLYYHTRLSLGNASLLEEPLGPSLGIQAQLPVLLAEYTFYEKEDIVHYLNLLADVGPYFQSILSYEQEKAAAGCFMSDATLDRILKQCQDFIRNPKENYMLEIFQQKLNTYGAISSSDPKKLLAIHEKLILQKVIPAYQQLMSGLKKLRGSGKSSRGLAWFSGGRQYYLYLLKSNVGTYVPVKKMEQRLYAQLLSDCQAITQILTKQPSLLSKVTRNNSLEKSSPNQMLAFLQQKMLEDFPAMEAPSYEIRKVHSSMEEYLSPAFYLTPPLDLGSPNVIYLNQAENISSQELFLTLAHEGFPGHLYQTVFFGRQNPSHIRYLLNTGGYTEGWATYVESYACRYSASLMKDEDRAAIANLVWLNRSVNLCLCSLLDIGIHYQGWQEEQCASFLKSFGIQDPASVKSLFQYIVETPANYLKYYWGYLNFLDLKTATSRRLGAAFDLKKYHEQILKIGPVPFPVLEKYIKKEGTA